VAFAVVAFAAVDDPYNQPICQGSAGYAGQLVEQIQLRLARADYYNGSIDGVERQWNTPGGRSANISALTACQKEKSIHQAVFQKLGIKMAAYGLYGMNGSVHNQSRSLLPPSAR